MRSCDASKVNTWGWVAHGIPFKLAWEALKYCKLIEKEDDREYNPTLAKLQAREIRDEVVRLEKTVGAKLDECHKQIRNISAERDLLKAQRNSTIEIELKEDKLKELIGYCHALTDVFKMLSDRDWELFDLGRMKLDDTKRHYHSSDA